MIRHDAPHCFGLKLSAALVRAPRHSPVLSGSNASGLIYVYRQIYCPQRINAVKGEKAVANGKGKARGAEEPEAD
jgi:hypothetical protein